MSLLLALTGGGTPANYAITASAGAYAYTGTSATISKSRFVYGVAGVYIATGQSATILKSKMVVSNSGNYAVAGQDALISRGGSGLSANDWLVVARRRGRR